MTVEIPTGIKQGTKIVELKTGKEMIVTHDYRATEVAIGLHVQVMAKYKTPRDHAESRIYRQFLFSELGTKWDYK